MLCKHLVLSGGVDYESQFFRRRWLQMICVLCFCNKFLFLPQKRHPSRTGQNQNWWQRLNSCFWGFPHITFTQDSLTSQRVLGTSNASAASQLCWADRGAGFPVQGGEPQLIIALVSRLFSSAFFFCNLNSELTQLRCLGIKQQLQNFRSQMLSLGLIAVANLPLLGRNPQEAPPWEPSCV